MGEMGSDEDPGEADTHLDATKQCPQSSFQIPVKIKAQIKPNSVSTIHHIEKKCLPSYRKKEALSQYNN